MKATLLVTFMLVALVIPAFSAVVSLTPSNYKKTIEEEQFVMVKYFTPWCGHCKKLAPIFEEASSKFAENGVVFAEVDCQAEGPLCSEEAVRGYPTIKFWRNGKASPYEGARSLGGFTSFLNKFILPPVSVFENKKDLKSFIKKQSQVMVGRFNSKESEAFMEFNKAAEELQADCICAALVNEKVEETLIKVFREDHSTEDYNVNEFTKDAILDWWSRYKVPAFAKITPDNAMTYVEAPLPVGYLYADIAKSATKKLHEELTAVAEEFRGIMLFTLVDSTKYGQMSKSMGLTGEKFPCFTIEDPEKNHFAFPEEDEITTEKVKEFIQKMLNNELEATIRSQPIPETPLVEDVYQLVGLSFNDVVLSSKAEVLVKFYAPWCGHCKKMKPAYSEVGKKYENDEGIVIAEMDLTGNDPPSSIPRVTGFPTLMFFAGDKSKPIMYQGSRTAEDMIEFIEKHRTGAAPAEPEEEMSQEL